MAALADSAIKYRFILRQALSDVGRRAQDHHVLVDTSDHASPIGSCNS
jgi:hypothetical protein